MPFMVCLRQLHLHFTASSTAACKPNCKPTASIAIKLMMPDKRRRDIDNRIKPILDLLCAHQVIAGDDSSIVKAVSVSLAHGGPGAHVEVTAL